MKVELSLEEWKSIQTSAHNDAEKIGRLQAQNEILHEAINRSETEKHRLESALGDMQAQLDRLHTERDRWLRRLGEAHDRANQRDSGNFTLAERSSGVFPAAQPVNPEEKTG
jgi:chromosome segregation ATPase